MIRDHWFRPPHDDPTAVACALGGCGKPQEAHVETVGEWTAPRHWWRPAGALRPLCGLCGRHYAHSTHWLVSRKNRSLWVWPHAENAVIQAKDWVMRSSRCRAFSPRLKLPCLRAMEHSCQGVCDRHYE